MSLTITEEDRPQRELIEAGNHRAVLYSQVDMGHLPNQFDDKQKEQHKVRLTFELADITREFDGVQKPVVISTEKTLSLNEKSSLRAMLEGWRGQAFTSAELKKFSLKNLLGKPALVNVVHKTSAAGRTYATIASVSKLPKGMKAPKQFNDSVYYEIEEGEGGVFSALPQWLQDKIRQSREFRTGKVKTSTPVAAAAANDEADDNGVPF